MKQSREESRLLRSSQPENSQSATHKIARRSTQPGRLAVSVLYGKLSAPVNFQFIPFRDVTDPKENEYELSRPARNFPAPYKSFDADA